MYQIINKQCVRADSITQTSAFSHGSGIFETIKLQNRRPKFLRDHLNRMTDGATKLQFTKTNLFELVPTFYSFCRELEEKEGALKIILTENGCVYIGYEKRIYTKDKYQQGFKLTIGSLHRNTTSRLNCIKSLNCYDNMLELKAVRNRGFDEAILINENGFIAEGCISNIFWERDGITYTPSIECGLLPGIIRQRYIQSLKTKGQQIIEGKFRLDELDSADRIFVCNSLMEIMPARLCKE